jgi:hypothetical protein
MENTELHCVQLIMEYISLVVTLKLEKLPRAEEFCHAVYCVLYIVEECFEVFDHSIRMYSVTAVLASHEFGLHI